MCRRTSMEYVTEAILNLRMAVKAHASLVGKSIPRPKLQKILKELDAEYDKTLKQKTRERTIRQLHSCLSQSSIQLPNPREFVTIAM